ncbi:LlaJI family restriction endonuclease [Pseudidiomarina gelatinasegens]|uniref:LlaJI family restriction endonuclease n=1 Tax=Pseudidiomarina gelatinasegens TaxID=2487740 RepID=A0A443YVK8_9GAMM|nr:LlaJI family restriction endonuclease [Pseudidiomarina gelatinasegens]RWU07967.1 LlaJI family restriction endonuclease [Pseudidiomarina gelatinasegens]
MQPNIPVLVNDRIELSLLPADIQNHLLRYGLITSGGQKACFCGLLKTNEHIYVFLPRKMEQRQNSLPGIFAAIRKYSNHSNSLVDSEDGGDNLLGKYELTLISDILTDYRQNGIYTRRNRLNTLNKGKPNWSKTVSKFDPLFSIMGPIYLNYAGSISLNQADSEASRVHAYIVKLLDITYGKILFGSSNYQSGVLPLPQNQNENYLLSVLNSELQNLYSDRDIRLFNHLIKYIKRIHGKNNTNVVIGIKGFHTLWEHMLKSIITGAVDINSEFSIPTYITSTGEHLEAPQKGQRTDIITHDKTNNVYAIIDAKYYHAQDLKNAPGWSDLLKQFFYAKAVKSIAATSRVKNYFIFPGDKQVLTSAYMRKRNVNEADADYANIQCLYVDPQEVIEAYTKEVILENLSKQLIS